MQSMKTIIVDVPSIKQTVSRARLLFLTAHASCRTRESFFTVSGDIVFVSLRVWK